MVLGGLVFVIMLFVCGFIVWLLVVVNSVVHFNFLLLIYSVIEIWLFGCNDGVLAVGLLWIVWVAA